MGVWWQEEYLGVEHPSQQIASEPNKNGKANVKMIVDDFLIIELKYQKHIVKRSKM